MFQFLIENKAPILGFLFAFSEVLALIPSVKANSVAQLVFNLIAKAAGNPRSEAAGKAAGDSPAPKA